MDIDEQSVNDILDLDKEHEGWSYFSIEEELPLLTNNCLTKSCEEISTDIVDTFLNLVKIIPNFTGNKMDIDEQSVNDILDLDEEHEGWSDFSIEEELPLLK